MFKLIVGLGNPGRQYENTRHNAGFWFVDELMKGVGSSWVFEKKLSGKVSKIIWQGNAVVLLKPETFMNLSGASVFEAAKYYRATPEEVLVVHDELELLPGQIKIKTTGGHAGHNGLRDIILRLGSNNFKRVRVGIGRPAGVMTVSDFVLSKPSAQDSLAIEGAIKKAILLRECILAADVENLANLLH